MKKVTKEMVEPSVYILISFLKLVQRDELRNQFRGLLVVFRNPELHVQLPIERKGPVATKEVVPKR
jgi:hypothetical protein